MNDAATKHPEVETMVAFIDGLLPPSELAEVTGHLRDCADCRLIVTETAGFEREEEREASTPRPAKWWFAAAAIVTVAIATPLVLRNWTEPDAQWARLVEAAPPQHRFLEPRLSDFPWAQLRPPARSNAVVTDPADLRLIGAAGDVLQATENQQGPESLHARGAALLLLGSHTEAIVALEQAATASNDPRFWSDLAAARLAVAVAEERPSQLPLALAAIDRAIALEPKSPEARFNHALILEKLGIRDHARKAWQHYLTLDPAGAWALEAREHLRALEDQTQLFEPKLLESTPAAELVRRFPQESRTWAEGMLLADWADAVAGGDRGRAESRLSLSRAIGQALASATQEHLLADAVAAIDRSSGTARTMLVDAHRLYRDARKEYSRREAGTAEGKFVRAAALFDEAGSPMAGVARYYAAGAVFAGHRGEEAHAAQSRASATIDDRRHRALAAQLRWSLALHANANGDWGAAARFADAASATFHSLGERDNAASVDGIAADALDMIGSDDPAWTRRIQALQSLTAANRGRFLRSAAVILDRFGKTAGAMAMIGLAIEDLRDDPPQRAAALSDRARYADHLQDPKAADHALSEARAAAAGTRDPALRETLNASIDVAAAARLRRTEPHAAVATLNRAITFFAEGRLRHFLPDAYLERARAHRSAGNDTSALADYAAAMREIENQRTTIGDAQLRLRFLDTAARILEEHVELLLTRGSVAEAFRLTDQAREMFAAPRTPLSDASRIRLAPGTVVIEYVVLPHAIAIFCLSADQLTVEKVVVERTTLATRIASVVAKIRGRAPVGSIESEAAELHRLLIAPVESRLASAREIVIIPDQELYALPFAALYDASRRAYLAERFTIRFAPSASSAAENDAHVFQPAVVIADPTTPSWPRLPASRAEGERIAAFYSAAPLTGAKATRKRFLDAASDSALIHYAGHADSDAGHSYGALLLAAEEGDAGILSSSDIARLTLRRHPLVVLAACGTFRGDPAHVAGMSSLVRSFLLAGAQTVIGTSWEVDDDVAARFFLRFHEHLRAGASPARAVNAAQLEMIHASEPRLQHPATWAPVAITQQSFRRMSWTAPPFISSAWSSSPPR